MINKEIRDKEVRVLDTDGEMLGVMPSREAYDLAVNKNLDLVKVSPNADPPVCKIMDYGKYVFEKAKKEKDAKKKQKMTSVKEIRLSPSIDDHDFSFKVKNAAKFLEAGDKVKVSMRFRGREISYSAQGKQTMERFAQTVQEVSKVDRMPKMEGRSMVMILSPL